MASETEIVNEKKRRTEDEKPIQDSISNNSVFLGLLPTILNGKRLVFLGDAILKEIES